MPVVHPHDPVSARLLLAGAVGALVAAGWSLALAPVATLALGATVPAVVTTTSGCGVGGQDTVAVQLPTGPVVTRLDGCGQAQGSTILVVLAANGAVGNPVTLAGTRAARGPSRVPVIVLAVASSITVGCAAASVRAGRAGLTRG